MTATKCAVYYAEYLRTDQLRLLPIPCHSINFKETSIYYRTPMTKTIAHLSDSYENLRNRSMKLFPILPISLYAS